MYALVFLFLFLTLPAHAQMSTPENRLIRRIGNIITTPQRQTTCLFGVGKANLYDTYLSPVNYKGPQMHVEALTIRPLKSNEKVLFETNTRLHLAYTENKAQTANESNFLLTTDLGWTRAWRDILPRTDVRLGGLWGMDIGGTYNSQNGNNPAQGRLATRLSATLGATYRIPLFHRTLRLNYQASLPLLGLMFSPQYGQSYYNLFVQGDWDHNIIGTHPGNALSLFQRFTLSVPCRRRTLVVGYESLLQQAQPNHLRQHHYIRSFVIGWSL